MHFVLNLLTFLFIAFGVIFCFLTTEKNKNEIRLRVFGDRIPTPKQNDNVNYIFVKTQALGVFLIILAIGFTIARIF